MIPILRIDHWLRDPNRPSEAMSEREIRIRPSSSNRMILEIIDHGGVEGHGIIEGEDLEAVFLQLAKELQEYAHTA